MHLNNSTLLLIFTAVTSIGVLLQAGVLLAFYFGMRHAELRTMQKIDEIRADIAPFLQTAQNLVEETAPKIRTITDHLLQASEHIRVQAGETNTAVAEIVHRTRQQAERIDGMVTEVLDTLADGARLVEESVVGPLRQVGGWLSAAKAMVDTIRRPEGKSRPQRKTHVYEDTY